MSGSSLPKLTERADARADTLRQRIRDGLPGMLPGLVVFAEGLPTPDGPIDLLARDANGRVVVVLVSPKDAFDDAHLFTRALATRAWLRSQLPGWLQFVPALRATATTPVRCILLATHFSDTTRRAAECLRPETVDLAIYRSFGHDGDEWLLLEHLARRVGDAPPAHEGASSPRASASAATASAETALRAARRPNPERSEVGSSPPTASPAGVEAPRFRSGLTDRDLDLGADELASLSPSGVRAGETSAARSRAPRKPRFDPN